MIKTSLGSFLLCSYCPCLSALSSLSPCLSEVDDVLRRANASEYGLASGVFTRDISKALYVSERLNAGTVFVNTYNKTDVASPFGGFKQSGFGKDLGKKICCCFSVAVVLIYICFMYIYI